jgi:hypothetical protein
MQAIGEKMVAPELDSFLEVATTARARFCCSTKEHKLSQAIFTDEMTVVRDILTQRYTFCENHSCYSNCLTKCDNSCKVKRNPIPLRTRISLAVRLIAGK